MIVFRSGYPFEVTSRDFRLQSEDQLWGLYHPSILTIYSPLVWLITSEELHRTSSPVTPSVIAIQSLARTASYSASLLETEKPRVKDSSIIDLSEVVRIIQMSAPLLFETYRSHPSSKSYYRLSG